MAANETFELFTSLRYDKVLLDVPTLGIKNAGWNLSNASALYMLDFHRDRMLRAATFWGWTGAIDAITGDEGLQRLMEYVSGIVTKAGTQNTPQRIKVVLSKDGELSHETSPAGAIDLANLFPARLPPSGLTRADSEAADPLKEPIFEVAVDTIQTDPSEFTHFKTTKRRMYDGARSRGNIAVTDNKEVLIVNVHDNTIMEGSVTTPYFWRGGRWVTPPVSRGYDPNSGSGGQDGTTRRWSLERNIAAEEPVTADSLVNGEECWISNGVRGFRFGIIKL
ncbi:putative aminodeoxychorismate lyase [Zalerion maritima]|uniref:Aminodeoxychorismate lyase n=1 Tax=Zalerion maritima TaxID=339359 RepID=A0AAD5WQG2_9PEZI|nr:putative aminodeoxychorismate lyase [Zalerion maritima]